MKTLIAAALCAMSIAAIADTTTFICTDAAGKKSLQDRACPPTSTTAEARATKTNPKPLFTPPDTQAITRGIWCSHYKSSADYHRDLSNVGNNNATRAQNRDYAIAQQNRFNRECK